MNILMLLLEAAVKESKNQHRFGITLSTAGASAAAPIALASNANFDHWEKSRSKAKVLDRKVHRQRVDTMRKKFGLKNKVWASKAGGKAGYFTSEGGGYNYIAGAGKRGDAVLLAHEMGHAALTEKRGRKLSFKLANHLPLGPFVGVAAGGAMLNSENKKVRKYAPVVGGAIASAELADEMLANRQAYKALRKGFKMKPKKALAMMLKHSIRPQSTYLALPAMVTSGIYGAGKYQDHRIKQTSGVKKGK